MKRFAYVEFADLDAIQAEMLEIHRKYRQALLNAVRCIESQAENFTSLDFDESRELAFAEVMKGAHEFLREAENIRGEFFNATYRTTEGGEA